MAEKKNTKDANKKGAPREDRKAVARTDGAELVAVTPQDVETRMIMLRRQPMLIDADVAELYGVETKRVNEAVKNNPGKFPYGYLFELDRYEKAEVVENFDHLKKLKFSKVSPTAFTERGLYMLATILKGERAAAADAASAHGRPTGRGGGAQPEHPHHRDRDRIQLCRGEDQA